MNNKNINKSKKTQNHPKKPYDSFSEIIKDIQPKYKVINKYLKLEELKHEDKVYRFKDGFIDAKEKPNFFFMRSELKTKNNQFTPTINLWDKNKNKTIFFNYNSNSSGRKINTEIYPNNFEDIESLIELKKIKNEIATNKFLLNNKDYHNFKNIKYENAKKGKKEFEKIKKINLVKNKTSENITFTKSIILGKNKNIRYNLNIDNSKKKRPITAKSNPKISINLLNKNKIFIRKDNRSKEIKSAKTQSQKSQKEYLVIQNIKNTFSNSSNRNISSYTTTFKSYSKSLSKQNKNKKFKNIEKEILNLNSNIENNEFNSTKQIINRVLNDCKIIDKYIRNKGLVNTNSTKNDKEAILLKLADRLKKNRIRKLTIKKKKDNKTHQILEDEKVFEDKLEKIPYVAKKFFREVYKQILFEKRVLNKIEKTTIIDAIEEKQTKKKINEQIKNEAKEKMILTKENLITEKDDKKLLEEQRKLFDFYGNLDGLEWLITKRNIINFGKNKI